MKKKVSISVTAVEKILRKENVSSSPEFSRTNNSLYAKICQQLNLKQNEKNRKRIQTIISRHIKDRKKAERQLRFSQSRDESDKRNVKRPARYNSSEFEIRYKVRRNHVGTENEGTNAKSEFQSETKQEKEHCDLNINHEMSDDEDSNQTEELNDEHFQFSSKQDIPPSPTFRKTKLKPTKETNKNVKINFRTKGDIKDFDNTSNIFMPTFEKKMEHDEDSVLSDGESDCSLSVLTPNKHKKCTKESSNVPSFGEESDTDHVEDTDKDNPFETYSENSYCSGQVDPDLSDYVSDECIKSDTDSDKKQGQNLEINKKEILLNLKYVDWKSMKPSKKKPFKLRTGWTDLLASKFRKEMPSCSLKFKYHNVRKKHSRKSKCPYLRAKAVCKGTECGMFEFILHDKPQKHSDVSFLVTCRNIRHKESERKHKRHLKGKLRQELQKELMTDGVSNTHFIRIGEMTEEEINFGNMSHCQTADVLRKAKSEKNLSERLHCDPFTELVIIQDILRNEDMNSKKTKGYIQNIGFSPFFAALLTEKQIIILRQRMRKSPLTLHLDATGTVIEKVLDKRVLYYALVLKGDIGNPPIPCFEFISNSQTTPAITHGLMIFLHSVNAYTKNPEFQRIEIDFSWALIHSVIMAFNHIDIRLYLNWCFELLTDGKMRTKYTVVHICSNHFIKAVIDRMSKLNVTKEAKELLIRCVALMVNCTTLEQTVTLWKAMLSTFGSKEKTTQVETDIKEVEKHLEEFEVQTKEDLSELICNEEWVENDKFSSIRKSSPFWAMFQMNEISIESNTSEPNPYYCKEALNVFGTEYMPLVPLWSGLLLDDISRHSDSKKSIVPTITRDSNASVENWMKIVKKDTLQNHLRMRVGKFVQKMHSTLKGRLLAFEKDMHHFKPKGNCKEKDKEKEQFNKAEESWAKKGTPIGKKDTKYFKAMPSKKDDKTTKGHVPPTPRKHTLKSQGNKKNDNAEDLGMPDIPLHGIKNVRNTCWAISSLQAIASSEMQIDSDGKEPKDELMQWICDMIVKLRTPVKSLQVHDLTDFMNLLIDKLRYNATLSSISVIWWQSALVAEEAADLGQALLRKDTEMNDNLRIGRQHDCAVFLEYIFNRANIHLSLIVNITCIRCNEIRKSTEVMSVVPVEIPPICNPTINLCLQELFKEEVLMGDDKCANLQCERCEANTPHTRKYEFNSADIPEHICLQLKRYKQTSQGIRKINTPITIDRCLFVAGSVYQLRAVQCHSGGSITQGHYWTVTSDSEGVVIMKDDKNVKIKSTDFLSDPFLQVAVYVLFYKRCPVINPYIEQRNEAEWRHFQESVLQGSDDETISSCNNIALKRKDIRTLLPGMWLNDQIINFYLRLLESDEVMAIDVFFWLTMITDKSSAIRKFLQKKWIFDYRVVLVPVIEKKHWTLCVIDTEQKTVITYDSNIEMMNRQRVMQNMQSLREILDDLSVKEETKKWNLGIAQNIPQQNNGDDCGVYLCQFAVAITRQKPIRITRESQDLRNAMIIECVTGQLLSRDKN